MIADEAAIGVMNHKTTAVRVIPAVGLGVGDMVEFGGLLGRAPVMPTHTPARRRSSPAAVVFRRRFTVFATKFDSVTKLASVTKP